MRYRLVFKHLTVSADKDKVDAFTEWIKLPADGRIAVSGSTAIEIEQADTVKADPEDSPRARFYGRSGDLCPSITTIHGVSFRCDKEEHPNYSRHLWRSPDGDHSMIWKDGT